ncbi:hypothetical protein Pint_15872 [Pistacia integerrima]|uniref:Uncharacterized protein n=1 Tax=Pistacia integerrima TaxID=434235 RepID=A0ACC0Z9X5_9ROSI|nr:hypothetical protein Pint_15872 [Pistacia integerrima]
MAMAMLMLGDTKRTGHLHIERYKLPIYKPFIILNLYSKVT